MALSDRAAVDRYYARIDEPDRLRKLGKTQEALASALAGVELLPALVRETVREYGTFDLSSLPPLDNVCTLACIRRDRDALSRAKQVVEALPQLSAWLDSIDGATNEIAIVEAIFDHLRQHPSFIQSKMPGALGYDGRRVSRLLHHLVTDGAIVREPLGKSYRLFASRES